MKVTYRDGQYTITLDADQFAPLRAALFEAMMKFAATASFHRRMKDGEGPSATRLARKVKKVHDELERDKETT